MSIDKDTFFFCRINISTDQLPTFNKDFGDRHLDVLAGYAAQKETTKGLFGIL